MKSGDFVTVPVLKNFTSIFLVGQVVPNNVFVLFTGLDFMEHGADFEAAISATGKYEVLSILLTQNNHSFKLISKNYGRNKKRYLYYR